MYQKIVQEINKFKNTVQAKNLQWFFKTGKGEYGEGDVFLGLKMAQTRNIVRKYFREASLIDVQKLLNSKIHEYRMCGVLILVEQYKKVSLEILRNPRPPRKRERCGQVLTPAALPARLQAGGPAVAQDDIFSFYLKNIRNINNWDLVDLSAPNIVGDCLLNKNKNILYKLIKSKNLWERRIVVLACFAFIKNNNFSDAIKISKILLTDKHDLIHKAVGWMLREVGKRNEKILINFLNKYTLKMPRTMLRYAIEKLPEKKRKYYLNKK